MKAPRPRAGTESKRSTGACSMAGKRPRPVGPDEARRLLADGTSACSHCRPDTALGIVGLQRLTQ
ncbi:DUF6233 domain-containing protein [Streptomyces olivaceoviridis]|uniref:DUF6233 domain-containing protein n=1 Tax=Streptomyces olivaceoviridis TaxID=1921 RepID=UPI00367B15FE